MATTYTWNISQLDCYPEHEGQTNVVSTIHWQCVGIDGDFSNSVYSTTGVTLDVDSPYTPYADLTKEQVLGWIWANGVDKEVVESAVEQQIQNLKNPPIIRPVLPWNSELVSEA
jgi:hypothetical protein